MRKTPALFAIVIMLSGGAARSAQITGVVLRSYQTSEGTWIAHLANVSHKNVVFVNITVNKHNGAGNYYAIAAHSEGYYSELNTFRPDTTKDISLGAEINESTTPVLDLVVYADDTVEVANEDALKHYLLPIKEKVLTLQKENEILAKFASSPNRVADTLAELLSVAADLPDPHMRHDDDPHVNSDELLSFARELKRGDIDPDSAIKRNADEIEVETKHAHVSRITGDAL